MVFTVALLPTVVKAPTSWTMNELRGTLASPPAYRRVSSRNIQRDEVDSESLSLNSSKLLVWDIVVHHSAQDHVVESVDPERREDEKDEGDPKELVI
jgi:hypothetical protein